MKLDLSVVICTYNRASNLNKCLESLANQSFKHFEVVIIDGGSTDNTNNIIQKHAKHLKIKKYVFKGKDLAKVRDKGWRNSNGEIVAWIDDDVVVSKNWAKNALDILKKNNDIAGVSGPTIVKKNLLKKRDVFFFYNKKGLLGLMGKIWNSLFLEGKMYEVGRILKSGAWTPGSNFEESLKIKELKDVDYLEACNMFLRRNLIEKVKGFDFGYKGIGEWSELDLAMRIKKLGFRLVFSSKVKVSHNISQQGVYIRRPQAKLRMENFFKFYFKHIFKRKLSYIFKLSAYVLFLDLYWIYKAFESKNIKWFGGLIGTITGLKYAYEKR